MSDTPSNSPNQSSSDPNDTDKVDQQVNFSIDGEVGDAIGQSMDALKSVLGGIVGAVQDAMGPEGMKNLAASQWLAQVASTLEEVGTGVREKGVVPTGKTGELKCFLDRIDAELKGAKFEGQLLQFRSLLESALELSKQLAAGDTSTDSKHVDQLLNASGYFRAAATSVGFSNQPLDDGS